MALENIIKTAKGEEKADLVIKNAQIVNVLSEEIHKADIAKTMFIHKVTRYLFHCLFIIN